MHYRHTIQTPSPQHNYIDTSPRLSPCSDNASSSSDCDSEPDQVSTHSEQPPKTKRQRTTFSPMEVWELERAYRRQPYLMSEDEEYLVKRLGITAKSLKYWFQNRRAKSRKREEEMSYGNQSRSSEEVRFLRRDRHFRPSPLQTSESIRMSYPVLKNHLTGPPHRANYHYPSFKANQLRGRSSLLVPMLHLDQFKRRSAESARLSYKRSLNRYQLY